MRNENWDFPVFWKIIMSIINDMISPGGTIVVGFSSWFMMLTSFSMYFSTEDKPNSAT